MVSGVKRRHASIRQTIFLRALLLNGVLNGADDRAQRTSLSSGDAAGSAKQAGEAVSRTALGAGQTVCGSEAAASRGRTLHFGSQRGTSAEGTCHPPASAQTSVGLASGTARPGADARRLGAAKAEAGRVYGLVEVQVPKPEQPVNAETFAFWLRKDKLRQAFRREGHYLLRSNLREEDLARLWQHYVQLTEIEAVFRALKSDLAIRPIHHQKDSRIEAHIFVSFLAFCLYVTLRQRLRALAPGLTSRAVLEKMSAIQMVDVRVPTTDGRLLILPRYTQPEKDHQILLHELHLQLPAQPPPRILQQEIESVVEGANL